MSGRWIRRSASLVVVSAIALAACGDDGGGSGTTKDEYIADADEICVDSRKQAETVFAEVGFTGLPTAAEAQRALQALVPVMRESFGRRDALQPPEGEGAAIEAIDAAGREALAGFERAADDPAASLALMTGKTADPATEVDRLSAEYGITQCAGKD